MNEKQKRLKTHKLSNNREVYDSLETKFLFALE